MIRKTMKMLVVALIATFALSSMAEAAAPKKTVKHRPKHSSRVSSGAATTTAKKPLPKKPAASSHTTRTRTRSSASAQKTGTRKAPAKRRPSTKPH
jgi:hypothetical protein